MNTNEDRKKFDEFSDKMESRIQRDLLKMMNDLAIEAVEAGFTADSVAHCVGSSGASLFYNVIMDDTKGGVNATQEQLMKGYRQGVINGWDSKMKILRDPVEFAKHTVLEE